MATPHTRPAPANPSRWSGLSETTSRPASRPCLARFCTSPKKQPVPLRKALTPMADKPSVLFVCVHNAGRSQMAAGFLTHLGGGQVEVRSAGSLPGDQVNPPRSRRWPRWASTSPVRPRRS